MPKYLNKPSYEGQYGTMSLWFSVDLVGWLWPSIQKLGFPEHEQAISFARIYVVLNNKRE